MFMAVIMMVGLSCGTSGCDHRDGDGNGGSDGNGGENNGGGINDNNGGCASCEGSLNGSSDGGSNSCLNSGNWSSCVIRMQ